MSPSSVLLPPVGFPYRAYGPVPYLTEVSERPPIGPADMVGGRRCRSYHSNRLIKNIILDK